MADTNPHRHASRRPIHHHSHGLGQRRCDGFHVESLSDPSQHQGEFHPGQHKPDAVACPASERNPRFVRHDLLVVAEAEETIGVELHRVGPGTRFARSRSWSVRWSNPADRSLGAPASPSARVVPSPPGGPNTESASARSRSHNPGLVAAHQMIHANEAAVVSWPAPISVTTWSRISASVSVASSTRASRRSSESPEGWPRRSAISPSIIASSAARSARTRARTVPGNGWGNCLNAEASRYCRARSNNTPISSARGPVVHRRTHASPR